MCILITLYVHLYNVNPINSNEQFYSFSFDKDAETEKSQKPQLGPFDSAGNNLSIKLHSK